MSTELTIILSVCGALLGLIAFFEKKFSNLNAKIDGLSTTIAKTQLKIATDYVSKKECAEHRAECPGRKK